MANAGFGGAQAGSVETRSLRAINSQGQSFVNKDFVKNVAWLNNSVDTLSVYTQMLQKGVDDANQSFIEEIQGFAADLFVLFAGGQPTGIDIGDLKYVFQGLGALLGVNGDTPFPLNLVEAANNLFGNWIVPLPQFSDVIFDAIEAWAEDLGLSQELVESLETLNNSFVNLSTDVEDFITDLFRLLNVFGTNFEVLQPFWNALESLFGDLDMPSLQPVLDALSSVGVSVINSLTWVVDTLDSAISPLAAVSAGLVGGKGANVLPVVSDKTTQWTVGSNTATMWVYDQSEQAFKTVGSGITKSVITQHKIAVTPGKKLELSGSIKWVGIPSAAMGFQIAAAFYSDTVLLETIPVTIPAGHGNSGGYQDISATITVPPNSDGVKVGAWIDDSITVGTVYAKNLSLAATGLIAQDLIDGLVDDLLGFLNTDSPLNVLNLFGQIPSNLLGFVPVGTIGSGSPNLLINPGFDVEPSIDGQTIWLWTDTRGRSTPLGIVYTNPDGTYRELLSYNAIEVDEGNKVQIEGYAQWSDLVASQSDSIRLGVNEYSDKQGLAANLIRNTTNVATAGSGTNSSGFQKLSGTYTVPAGVKSFRTRLSVMQTATAGTVDFDDLFTGKSNLLAQNLVDELINDFNTISNSITGIWTDLGERLHVDEWDDWLDDTWQAMLNAVKGSSGGTIADMVNRLAHLGFDGKFDASQLSNIVGIPMIGAGKVTGLTDLQTEFDQMMSILAGQVVTPVNQAVQDVKNWFAQLGNKVQNLTGTGTLPPASVGSATGGTSIAQDVVNTVNSLVDGWTKFWNGVFKTPSDTTLRSAPEVQAAAESLSGSISEIQASTESLQSTILLPRTNPLWLSKWPQDDVSIPNAIIDSSSAPTLGVLSLIPVTATSDRIYQSIKFALAGNPTMDYCYIGIYSIDISTGNCILIANLGDKKSSLSGSYNQQSIALPSDISVSKGDIYMVGILQVGGIATAMLKSSNTRELSDWPTSYPTSLGCKSGTGLTSLPNSISPGNISAGDRFWAALGYGITPPPPPKTTFLDTFNRANGDLGVNWNNSSNPLSISGNAAVGSGSISMALCVPKFTTPNQLTYIYAPTNSSSPNDMSCILMASQDASSYVRAAWLVSGNGYLDIWSKSNGESEVLRSRTQMTGMPPVPSYAKAIWLSVTDGVYTARYNSGGDGSETSGTKVTTSWNDSGNLVSRLGTNRCSGIVSYNSRAIDSFCMKDI